VLAIMPFTAAQAAATCEAFCRCNKCYYSAALNFADCMSYAVAKVAECGLLFAGEHSTLTYFGVVEAAMRAFGL
jgi:ribonuclease VapC